MTLSASQQLQILNCDGKCAVELVKIVCFVFLFSLISSAVRPNPTARTYSVALIGDSLINRACNNFDLIGKLKDNLPDYDVVFTNYGVDGAVIRTIKQNLAPVLEEKPGQENVRWTLEYKISFSNYKLNKF